MFMLCIIMKLICSLHLCNSCIYFRCQYNVSWPGVFVRTNWGTICISSCSTISFIFFLKCCLSSRNLVVYFISKIIYRSHSLLFWLKSMLYSPLLFIQELSLCTLMRFVKTNKVAAVNLLKVSPDISVVAMQFCCY